MPPWDMVIDLDRDATRPLVLQIARAFISDSVAGCVQATDSLAAASWRRTSMCIATPCSRRWKS
jgi:hypothetical protein